MYKTIYIYPVLLLFLFSCQKTSKKEELRVADTDSLRDTIALSIATNISSSLSTDAPNNVILTSNDRFRLITIYKVPSDGNRNLNFYEGSTYSEYITMDSDDDFRYYMPGIDIISGWYLVNIAHYDVEQDTLTYFFPKPALIKTLYFPGVRKDSLHRKPISRNYYIVSVYDGDTNHDSLINRRDLRRMYHFDERNTCHTSLLPSGYSAIRSAYDYRLDAMYIHARFDANGNGTPEPQEPVSIFMLPLNEPLRIRKIY